MDVPGRPEPLMVTDAAINIAPDLPTKADITQNAIDLALSLDMTPRVGVLSAVETVNPAIQSSIDAALLSVFDVSAAVLAGLTASTLGTRTDRQTAPGTTRFTFYSTWRTVVDVL